MKKDKELVVWKDGDFSYFRDWVKDNFNTSKVKFLNKYQYDGIDFLSATEISMHDMFTPESIEWEQRHGDTIGELLVTKAFQLGIAVGEAKVKSDLKKYPSMFSAGYFLRLIRYKKEPKSETK